MPTDSRERVWTAKSPEHCQDEWPKAPAFGNKGGTAGVKLSSLTGRGLFVFLRTGR